MTVSELCELFVNSATQKINIWSNRELATVWKGSAKEVKNTPYADMLVTSIDNLETDSNVMVINVLNTF